MPAIRILSPDAVADSQGLHESGAVISQPSPELLALARKGVTHHAGGPLCELIGDGPESLLAGISAREIATDAARAEPDQAPPDQAPPDEPAAEDPADPGDDTKETA